jgi:RNA polymerase sigma-70 factor, ECF subfamily
MMTVTALKRTKESYRALETSVLVTLAQQQDRLAMELLVERHQRLVFVTLAQLLPERKDLGDLAQEALLRMCRSIGMLKEPKAFKLWLNRIVTNLFYDELRKQKKELNTLSTDQFSFGDDDSDKPSGLDIPDTKTIPEELALQSELDQKIYQAITNLPEPFRTVVVLRELQGLNYEEIASLTETTLGTVKSRLARARQRLQDTLKPYVEEVGIQLSS